MNNKIFCMVVGVVFIAITVGLCSVAVAQIPTNPFASVFASGFAAIIGVAGVDIFKHGKNL